jgi:hypothetical protein
MPTQEAAGDTQRRRDVQGGRKEGKSFQISSSFDMNYTESCLAAFYFSPSSVSYLVRDRTCCEFGGNTIFLSTKRCQSVVAASLWQRLVYCLLESILVFGRPRTCTSPNALQALLPTPDPSRLYIEMCPKNAFYGIFHRANAS